MSESKWTPGPWTATELDLAQELPGYDILLADDLSYRVAEVDAELVPHEQAVANARLIAAAPDMALALEKAVNCMDYYPNQLRTPEFQAVLEAARAALKKAGVQ